MSNRRHVTLLTVLTVTVTAALTAQSAKVEKGLLDVIRQGDSGAIGDAIGAGADPNAPGEMGAAPLMQAAAFAPAEALAVLLAIPVDVNRPAENGATALMWATGDTEKVRLLIRHGAAVNAQTKDGVTALVSAARRGNVEAMRLLLAHGARADVSPSGSRELLQLAYRSRPEIRRPLAEAGLKLESLDQLGPLPLIRTLTSDRGREPATVRELFDRGANPNESMLTAAQIVPAIGLAISFGRGEADDMTTIGLLLDRGVSPDSKSSRGLTPLMMAAASPRANVDVVRLLLDRGADVHARDDRGRTALDWALLQGETDIARVLRAAGTRATIPASFSQPSGGPRTAHAAVEAAVARLQPISRGFHTGARCISCHNQSLPAVALHMAASRGVAVDEQEEAHPVRVTLAAYSGPRLEQMLLGRCNNMSEITYSILALAEERIPASLSTDAIVTCLLSEQRSDGSWFANDSRPPLGSAALIPYTAMAVRGLEVYGPPGLRALVERSVSRGREFLRHAVPIDTQDESFKLAGLVWSNAPRRDVSRQVQRLLKLQRPDGGWGQRPTMASDAYATGQTLYALQLSGMLATHRVYQEGIAYLLRTQLEDGTWHVRSRAVPAQAYFEAGFPHGTDQFISAAATSWATIALAAGL